MKIYFAPDTSDHPNWGCQVMGAWFRSALARNGTPAAWRTGSQWFYRPNPALPTPMTMADFEHCAGQVREGRLLQDVAAALRECDLLLMNGENFIRPGVRKGRMLLLLAYLAKVVFDKPCVLTNLSIDVSEPALADMVRDVLPRMDEVHFREDTSAQAYSGLVPDAPYRLIPDVAWSVPAAPLAEWAALAGRDGHFCAWPDIADGFDPRQPYVTVCAGSGFSLPQQAKVDVVPAFIKLCRRLEREVAPVVLAAPCEVDVMIMRRVHAETGLPLLGIHLPVRQSIDVLGNAAVHVGGRWHLGIFAATGGTPLVPLAANSHKMHSLMQQLQLPGPVFDPLQLDRHIEAIVELAKARMQAGQALRSRIRDRSRELAAQVGQTMEVVRGFAAPAG